MTQTLIAPTMATTETEMAGMYDGKAARLSIPWDNRPGHPVQRESTSFLRGLQALSSIGHARPRM